MLKTHFISRSDAAHGRCICRQQSQNACTGSHSTTERRSMWDVAACAADREVAAAMTKDVVIDAPEQQAIQGIQSSNHQCDSETRAATQCHVISRTDVSGAQQRTRHRWSQVPAPRAQLVHAHQNTAKDAMQTTTRRACQNMPEHDAPPRRPRPTDSDTGRTRPTRPRPRPEVEMMG